MTRFRQKVKGVGFEPKHEPSPPHFEQQKKKIAWKSKRVIFNQLSMQGFREKLKSVELGPKPNYLTKNLKMSLLATF